jgi:dihydroflavonol-4-reductase
MKTLILGGSGFIGSWILKELNSRNYTVNVLSRTNNGHIESSKLKLFTGDCNNPIHLDQAMDSCDVVINAATYYPVYSVKRYEQLNTAKNELNTILNAAKEHNIKKFIFISTPTVLSASNESLSMSTYCFIKYYLHKKIECEINNGFPATIIIPGGCFGPGDWKVITGRVILEIISRRLRITIDGIMNVVDVRDVAKGVVEAALHGKTGATYQLGNWNCSFYEFAEKVAEIANIPPIRLKASYIMSKNISRLIELIQYYSIGGRPIFPEVGLDIVHFGSFLNSEEAIKDLNFTTLPVEKTVFDSIEWYRVNGYLKVNDKINFDRFPVFKTR